MYPQMNSDDCRTYTSREMELNPKYNQKSDIQTDRLSNGQGKNLMSLHHYGVFSLLLISYYAVFYKTGMVYVLYREC